MTELDRSRLADRVALLEARTGAQVVTVVATKSDSYPEVPWKAFALGASIAALLAALGPLLWREWDAAASVLRHTIAILGSGAALALLAVLFPGLARPFTDRSRRDLEVRQHARSLFFDRGLDRTRGRVGILLLVSLFEREVVLLADDGFDVRVTAHDWQELTQRVTFLLSSDGIPGALRAGMDGLEALLLSRGFRGDGAVADELPNAVQDTRGDR